MIEPLSSIALLGTSADPPTLGHQALLNGLIKLFPRVVTWASNNPEKKHVIPLKKRYQLLNLLVKSMANPQVQLIQDLSSPRTLATLEKAYKLWPNALFTFVIGSDLTSQVPNWLNAKKFLKKTRLGIAPRKGWPINKEHIKEIENLGGRIELLPLNIPAYSSSTFRRNHNQSIIPKKILQIILEENLYEIAGTKK